MERTERETPARTARGLRGLDMKRLKKNKAKIELTPEYLEDLKMRDFIDGLEDPEEEKIAISHGWNWTAFIRKRDAWMQNGTFRIKVKK